MIICGNCGDRHQAVITVKACHAGNVLPCVWLVRRDTEDGPQARECGAAAIVSDAGFWCEAGHAHVSAQVRDAEGWDYAEDDADARRLLAAGRLAVDTRTNRTYAL